MSSQQSYGNKLSESKINEEKAKKRCDQMMVELNKLSKAQNLNNNSNSHGFSVASNSRSASRLAATNRETESDANDDNSQDETTDDAVTAPTELKQEVCVF